MSKQNRKSAYNRVVVFVDVTQKGGSILFQATQNWEPVHQKHSPLTPDQLQEVPDLKITSDSAKLIAILKAMKTLVKKLPKGQKAPYELVIVQSSDNVTRWLQKPESRKVETTQKLGEYLDQLRQHFPNTRFEQRKAKAIATLINPDHGKSANKNTTPDETSANPTLAQLNTTNPL